MKSSIKREETMAKRATIHDFRQQKGYKKWLQVHVDSAPEATAAIEAGIEIIGCEADHGFESIRAAVPSAFIQAGMAHGAICNPDEAIKAGFALLERGADTIYCSHSPCFIEAMAREGIPVTGHVGLFQISPDGRVIGLLVRLQMKLCVFCGPLKILRMLVQLFSKLKLCR